MLDLKIPSKVRVMGRVFELIRSPKCPFCPDALLAAYDIRKGRIWLSNECHIEDQHAGLFHEIHEIILQMTFTIDDWESDQPNFTMTHDKFRDVNSILWGAVRDNKLFGGGK